MRTSVDAAMRRLHTLDPARDLETGTWLGSPAQLRAAAALAADTVAADSVAADSVAAPWDITPPPRTFTPRRRRWSALAAATVIVLGIGALVGVLRLQAGPVAGPSSGSTTGAGHHTPGITGASPRARTLDRLDSLLDEVRVPPGAHVRTSAPVRALRRPASTADSQNFLHRTRWWVAAGSVHSAFAYAKKHAPAGCHFDGSGSLSGPNQPTVYDIMCSASSTSYATQVEAQLDGVATRRGIALRADAQAIWIPTRPAYSRIEHPSSVHVVVLRGTRQPGVRRTVGAGAAGRIARTIDALSLEPTEVRSCPMAAPGYESSDHLRFTTARGVFAVQVYLSGCSGVSIKAPRHAAVPLMISGAVDASVRRALHLPKGYRR